MPRDGRPNILLYFTDQQRPDTIGAYRSPLDLTPHLDALAQHGTVFEQAFTPQPVCGPARSCIQTGRYATQTGCWRNGIMLRRDDWTFARALDAAGYDTAYLGKWHLADQHRTDPVPADERGGWDQTWEAADVLEFTSKPYALKMYDADNEVVRGEGYRVEAQTDRVIRYLNQPKDKPFCCMVSYLEPHHQNDMQRYVAPDGYAARYKNAWVPPDLRALPGDWHSEWPDYCGICASLDENLGRLVAELDRLGELDQTVILYFADHGCHFRTRNSEYKRSCHESSIHVPLVACGPGFEGGRRVTELTSLIDLAPTVCDLAGAGVPDSVMGRSLLPLARGDGSDWRDEAYVQISESCIARAIRTDRWKYCATAPDQGTDGCSGKYVETHLYDLWADPHEQANLVGRPSHRGIADGLRERLLANLRAAGEPEAEIVKGRFI